MREIKYRIWDIKRKRMLDSEYIVFNDGNYYEDYRDFEDGIVLNSIVVMQYTGLDDKNGVGIFEGDIVKNIRSGISRKVYWDTYCASFHLSKQGKQEANVDYWSLSNPKRNYEVIGSIYEHKHLLE